MTVTVPIVAIVGLVVFIAYRYMGLRIWHAVACLLAGFLLAATSAAPQINHALSAIVGWFQHLWNPGQPKGVMSDDQLHAVFRHQHSGGHEP
jgi:hypothetical protein